MFFIVEAGSRFQTPVDGLLSRRNVPAVNASTAVRPVDERDSPPPSLHQAPPEQLYRENEETPEPPRQRVRFAGEIMSSPVVTGHIDLPLNDIWRLFARHRVHHLPVIDDQQRVQGIVSDRDILRFAASNRVGLDNTPIHRLMTPRVITSSADTEVRELAEVMVSRGIGAIPVISEDETLDGIVTRSDILRTLVHRAPLDLWS